MNLTKTAQHVAFYLPSLRGGGAERVMVMLANGFAARGHRVDLVMAKPEGPYLSEVAPGVRVVDLNRGRVLTSLLPLVHYIRRERPDAMLSALSHSNIIAILARELARSPLRLVVSEHNAPSQAFYGGKMALLIRFLIRALYPKADAIACVSEGIRQEMHHIFGLPFTQLHRIYNPLDVDRIRETMGFPIANEEEIKARGPLILAAGRLTTQKDYPNLLAAFAILRATRQARLVILGEGDDERFLKAKADELAISDDVDFAGFQSNPFAWMRASDLYVLSSRWEGLSCTLLEALACGVRVVSTDCRHGPSEILEDGKWGRLVPVNDPEALALAMAAALDDENPPDVVQRANDFRSHQALSKYERIMMSSKLAQG